MNSRIHPLRPKHDAREDFEKLRRRWEKEELEQEKPLVQIPGWGVIIASSLIWAGLIAAGIWWAYYK